MLFLACPLGWSVVGSSWALQQASRLQLPRQRRLVCLARGLARQLVWPAPHASVPPRLPPAPGPLHAVGGAELPARGPHLLLASRCLRCPHRCQGSHCRGRARRGGRGARRQAPRQQYRAGCPALLPCRGCNPVVRRLWLCYRCCYLIGSQGTSLWLKDIRAKGEQPGEGSTLCSGV